jgi:hypothetical protein
VCGGDGLVGGDSDRSEKGSKDEVMAPVIAGYGGRLGWRWRG